MTPRTALSIAGSDPSGGAGIQADLKTFAALGVHGMAALAGLTVQNTQGVRAASPIDPGFVIAQVEAVLDDIEVHATKLGMLTNAGIAGAVADLITARRADLDPVMVATSGDRLLADEAVEVVRTRLLPLADLITPNVPETAVLAGSSPAGDVSGLQAQAEGLVAAGAHAVLAKGGHLAGEELTDLLVTPSGTARFTGARVNTRNTHGTGCTLSSAIAATAARAGITPSGTVPEHVVVEARDFLHRAILAGADWRLSRSPGTGHGPVNHLINLEGAQA